VVVSHAPGSRTMKPIFLCLFLVAYAFADSSEEIDEARFSLFGGGGGGESTKDYGVLKTFKDELSQVQVDFQIKNNDGYHELCLRIHAFKKLLGDKVIKPCVGLAHQKSEDDNSNVNYRFRIGKFTIYRGVVKFNKKLTACKNVPFSDERVCLKDMVADTVVNENGEKERTMCVTITLKARAQSYDICGTFVGLKLKTHKIDKKPFDANSMDAIPDNNAEIYPCGLIANSYFNDSFSNLTLSGTEMTFNFSSNGIAWPGDQQRFSKTNYGAGLSNGTIEGVAPPPNWTKYGGVYTVDTIPDVSKDEHLQVWMRTSGLPTFRKLYGKTTDTLPAGTWEITIEDIYPVKDFGGTKSVVFSTTSWIGGQNPFLGIAYLVVGSVCIALGIAFLIRHLVAPRKLGDHSYIKWSN